MTRNKSLGVLALSTLLAACTAGGPLTTEGNGVVVPGGGRSTSRPLRWLSQSRSTTWIAPASGMRSSRATSSPRATANGTPNASRTLVETIPAIRLIARLPVT